MQSFFLGNLELWLCRDTSDMVNLRQPRYLFVLWWECVSLSVEGNSVIIFSLPCLTDFPRSFWVLSDTRSKPLLTHRSSNYYFSSHFIFRFFEYVHCHYRYRCLTLYTIQRENFSWYTTSLPTEPQRLLFSPKNGPIICSGNYTYITSSSERDLIDQMLCSCFFLI